MATLKTLAFEIGTEEIPAFDLKNATEKLPHLLENAFQAARISHGTINVYSTPRRLALVVSDVPESTEELNETYKGPSVAIAFDESGNPTKAAEGFALGKGANVSDLEVREENGTQYVFVSKTVAAQSTLELLPNILANLIDSIPWPKSMRWSTHTQLFSRPVRWLVALLDTQIISLTYAGVSSGRHTEGHRVLSPEGADIASAADYETTIRSLRIVPTQDERKAIIEDAARSFEKQLGAGYVSVLPEKTLTEVVNLSEAPTPMLAQFDSLFLAVPEEIIVDAMLMHQRYFPLYKDGKLTNYFIVVSNGNPEYEDIIVDGNQRVVAARLYDAKFFYDEDLKKPLESYVELLDSVVFQEQLGTMHQKTKRIERLAQSICLSQAYDAALSGKIARAAFLAKADLVTNAVIEFTSVQGVMGSYYAAAHGEDADVSLAIAEHYKPKFAGDSIPSGVVGQIVALADKLDTICGLFAVGQVPTGSSDPFALRRAALGVMAILESGINVSLQSSIADALKIYLEDGLSFNEADIATQVTDFFITRLKVMLKDEGSTPDAIEAVLAGGVQEPVTIAVRVKALDTARNNDPETFDDLSVAYARANNLTNKSLGSLYNSALFTNEEHALADAIKQSHSAVTEALSNNDYTAALSSLAALRAPIDAFFESTMIMDDNVEVRENRMRLLNAFVDVFAHVADFGQLVSKK